MDKRLQEIINATSEKFGLQAYHLHTSRLYTTVDTIRGTTYQLSMEWFVNGVTERTEEDLNPSGTAVIEYDISSKRYNSVIFVGGETFATSSSRFATISEVIEWIEKETGLRHKEQFILNGRKQPSTTYNFIACHNGIPLSPGGMITVAHNDAGQLIDFSVSRSFPVKETIKEEPYTLTLDADVLRIADEQISLIEFPSTEENKWVPAYALEEIYITNDLSATYPFEFLVDNRFRLDIDHIFQWKTPLTLTYEEQKLSLFQNQEEVTAEQAFSNESHPDMLPITLDEQQQAIHAISDFLRSIYPTESGRWRLTYLYRQNNYIQAVLRPVSSTKVISGKIVVFLDSKQLQIVSYFDNQFFWKEVYENLEQAEPITIEKEIAFEKLKQHITLTPMYVLHPDGTHYVLCGKLDCDYGVLASSGDVILLDSIE
ncbi:hypothetical protein EEL31_10995 [Brevibacillus laterosporus]|uniref:DUF4901 domain-containing protein n=1 Tax=Brevibacillus laterosporus TaxID=1465 RepID=A0A518VDM2_BRELA|nr:hypothetical protein [Brevibacillus laterosporus]QDX95090.1 hypothetical protein EEL30_24035 [Brevibacillus laterosporus]TPG69000.1 hypothetical protein EEL31_10995 [Brevibacillus laterosporus]